MSKFTEDQLRLLTTFAEKYGLGHVENDEEENILELPVCGMSIAFEPEVLASKSLVGTTFSDGYVVYETIGSWEDDVDILEVGVYPTFHHAVIALLANAYERMVHMEVMEFEIHKAYEDSV